MLLAFLLTIFAQSSVQPDRELQKLQKALEKTPEDSKVHLELGLFLAFGRNRWEEAIPHLSKGSDEYFKQLAQLEQSGNPPLEIGNAWWDGSVNIESHLLTGATASMKLKMKRKARQWMPLMRNRAGTWYAKAWPSLSEDQQKSLRAKTDISFKNLRGRVTRLPAGWHTMPGENRPTKGCGLDTTWSRSAPASFKAVGGSHLRLGQFSCKPGANVKIDAWVRSEGTGLEPCEVRVRYFHSSGGLTHRGPAIEDIPYWHHVTNEFTAPDRTHHIDVVIYVGSPVGSVWVDDLSVTVDGKELVRDTDFDGRSDRR